MLKLSKFTKAQWVKNWSGNWSVLSCSYFGEQYTKSVARYTGTSFRHALFIFHGEHNFSYYDSKDLARLGKQLEPES
ncbi:MAG: hypothetical protein Q8R08_01445 [bacterium]|nr:hypothetical protein [bacterium]